MKNLIQQKIIVMKNLKYYTLLIAISFSILILEVHANPIVEIHSDKPLTLCAGDSVNLCAFICTGCAAPYTYKWYKNDTTLIDSVQCIKVKNSGAYCVKVTCGSGCKVTQCVRVTIGFPNYQADITNVSCYGYYTGKIKINSFTTSGCRKYQLSPGPMCGVPFSYPPQTSNVFTGLGAGNYCIKVIDTCHGCDTCICVTVTQPPLSFSSISHTAFAATYTWPVSASTFTASGIYTATLLNATGCDSVITLHLTLITATTTVLISTATGTSIAGYSGDHGLTAFAKLNNPNDVAYCKTKGNYYIADLNNHRIRMIDSSDVITTIAGKGVAGYNGDGGLAINAKINYPVSVAADTLGNVYFADQSNRRIRKIDVNGIITTIAGTGIDGYNGENIVATAAQISSVYGISVDETGNIYFSDYGNQRIRKIDKSTGLIHTIAGTGASGFSGDNGQAINAEINFPYGLYADGTGNVFFADLNNNRIRKINTSGIITTVAGSGMQGYNGDNINAVAANLFHPSGVKTDEAGNMFIADLYNHRIRKVDANGIITTIAGNGTLGYSGDGGSSILAQLNYPSNLTFDAEGNMLVSDLWNHVIRKVGTIDSPTTTKLYLELYLQGYYAGNGTMSPALMNQGIGNNSEVTDTITVELRNENSPYGLVASTSSLLYTNGNAVAFFPPVTGSYYIVVKHRNSIETWSANPVACVAGWVPWEWKTMASRAYGSNLTEVESGKFAIYSGDINQDQNIDLIDLATEEFDINAFQFGYFNTDINGDGNVDLLDSPILETNISNFIFSNHP